MSAPGMGWQPHADAWALVILLAGGYLYALSAWGPRHAPGGIAATRRHRLYFFSGVGSLWLAADWPVHQLANELFSVHMAQHLIFSLVSAPLLILGTPAWLLRRLLSPPPIGRMWRAVTRPLPALVLFNTWIALYHFRGMVNLSVANDGFHLFAHVMWVAVSLIM
ncbi:MAG: cytochrome c oxidase assembly protein, partial [Chloroflexi bacterium]|nr:cytochrome c oxidase assembly protein [Chloroflexota bacterium]